MQANNRLVTMRNNGKAGQNSLATEEEGELNDNYVVM